MPEYANDAIRALAEATGHEICPRCGCCSLDHEWEPCESCWGEGMMDLYEEDPIFYAPGEEEVCSTCQGRGGFSIPRCLGNCDKNGVHKKPTFRDRRQQRKTKGAGNADL